MVEDIVLINGIYKRLTIRSMGEYKEVIRKIKRYNYILKDKAKKIY